MDNEDHDTYLLCTESDLPSLLSNHEKGGDCGHQVEEEGRQENVLSNQGIKCGVYTCDLENFAYGV